MLDQPFSDLTVTGHDVQDAVGKAGSLGELGKPERRAGCGRRGLEHDGASRGDGRADLPHGHDQGKVPRCDRAHDTDRATLDHRRVSVREGAGRGSSGRSRRSGEEPQVVDQERDFAFEHRGVRPTGVLDLHPGQCIGVRLDEIGQPEQDLGSVARRGVGPVAAAGAPGCVNGPIDVRYRALGDAVVNPSCRRVDQVAPTLGVCPCSVDPQVHVVVTSVRQATDPR